MNFANSLSTTKKDSKKEEKDDDLENNQGLYKLGLNIGKWFIKWIN